MSISPVALGVGAAAFVGGAVAAHKLDQKIADGRGHGDPIASSYMVDGFAALAGGAVLAAMMVTKSPEISHAMYGVAGGLFVGGMLGSTSVGLASLLTK